MIHCIQRSKHASRPLHSPAMQVWEILKLRPMLLILKKALTSCEYDQSSIGVLFREAKFLLSNNSINIKVDYCPRIVTRWPMNLQLLEPL
uniref:Uncharacterized protein n=1 Tax=Arundo donax TaxID=35708 RepID=A0A0A9ESQ2_ARUDO